MKGKALFAALFVAVLWLSLHMLAQAQAERDASMPLPRTAVQAVLPPAPQKKDAAGEPGALPEALPRQERRELPPAPVCSRNGTPVLKACYFRAAYEAFHFSDRAG